MWSDWMKKVVIVGIGRMGETLADKLRGKVSLFLYDVNHTKAKKIAQELNVQTADLNELAEMEIVILALPAGVMTKAVQEMKSYFKADVILVNIATSCPQKAIVDAMGSGEQVVSAKFVGHAKEIKAGEIPTIVIDAPSEQLGSVVADILAPIGKIIFASEDIVAKLNTLAAEEGIRAALRVKRKMIHLGLPEELFLPAVRGVAAGTMKAYAVGDAGPFVKELAEKILAEIN